MCVCVCVCACVCVHVIPFQDDMQTSVARTLQRYHINTKHDFIDALEEHNLLRTPARAKTEVT